MIREIEMSEMKNENLKYFLNGFSFTTKAKITP